MIRTLMSLQGNPKPCIWLEPLWGIPYNLCLPYATLFMTALGINYAQIGYISSITMVSQMIFAVLSGALTDKLGRKRCTVIFDVLSWSVPEILWMCSQNFMWFAVAALFNGMWRVTENSWYLMMIEDADRDQVIKLNSLTNLMGLIVAFIAPLSKFAVDAFGIVPTMRVLYGFAAVSMTAKFLILNHFVSETGNGVRRMEATKNQSVWALLGSCRRVYMGIVREKRMLLTLGILAAYMLMTTLNGNYWALYLRDMMGVREGDITLFVTLRSLATLVCSFAIVPKLNYRLVRRPLLSALAAFAVSQGLLLAGAESPAWLVMLIASVVLEAAALTILSPVTNSLLFINAEENQRAMIVGMVYATVTMIVSVFPALVGLTVHLSLRIPFFVNIGILALLAVMSMLITRLPEQE